MHGLDDDFAQTRPIADTFISELLLIRPPAQERQRHRVHAQVLDRTLKSHVAGQTGQWPPQRQGSWRNQTEQAGSIPLLAEEREKNRQMKLQAVNAREWDSQKASLHRE